MAIDLNKYKLAAPPAGPSSLDKYKLPNANPAVAALEEKMNPKGNLLTTFLSNTWNQYKSVGQSISNDIDYLRGIPQGEHEKGPLEQAADIFASEKRTTFGGAGRALTRGLLGYGGKAVSATFAPVTAAAQTLIPGTGPLAQAGQGATIGAAAGGPVGALVGGGVGLGLAALDKLTEPLKESHPEAYANIHDAVNVGLALLGGKGAKELEGKAAAGAKPGEYVPRDPLHAPVTEAPGIIARNLAETGRVATKPLVKSGQFVAKVANGLARYGTSQATGLSPETISRVLSNPEHFAPEEMANYTREKVAGEALANVSRRLEDLSETGREYGPVRESKSPVVIEPGTFEKVLERNGIKIDEKTGKLQFDRESIPTSSGDRAAIQQWYDTYGKGENHTSNSFLNARKALDQMAQWDATKTDSANILAMELRKTLNEAGRDQVEGLKALDERFTAETNELKKVKKDYFNSDGTLKDNAVNKLGNAAGKGKDVLLARLEEVSPGVTEKLRTMKAIEDIHAAGGQKVGTYARGGAIGAAVVTGNLPVLLAAILTYPSMAVKILRGYGKALGVKNAAVERIVGEYESFKANPKAGMSIQDVSASPELKPLVAEAKKYKTADEFVAAFEKGPVVEGSESSLMGPMNKPGWGRKFPEAVKALIPEAQALVEKGMEPGTASDQVLTEFWEKATAPKDYTVTDVTPEGYGPQESSQAKNAPAETQPKMKSESEDMQITLPQEEPAVKAPGVSQGVTDYLQKNFGTTFEKATRKQIAESMRFDPRQGVATIEEGPGMLKKMGSATKGLVSDAFGPRPEMLGTVKEGALTDSFILIKDKAVAQKFLEDYATKEATKIARSAERKGTIAEGKTVEDVIAIEKARILRAAKDAKAPNWKVLMPEKPGNKAYVQGYTKGPMGGQNSAHITDGVRQVEVNADKLAFMRKHLPDAEIHISGAGAPVEFVVGGEVKGLIMPLRGSSSPFEISKGIPKAPKGLAAKAAELTKKNGGVTINLNGDIPEGGFAYSPFKDAEFKVPKKKFSEADVDAYIEKEYNRLSQTDGAHLGMWEDGGQIYIDISKVEPNEQAAIADAVKNDQLAVFDLSTFETKYTKDYEKTDSGYSYKGKDKGAAEGGSAEGAQGEGSLEGAKEKVTFSKFQSELDSARNAEKPSATQKKLLDQVKAARETETKKGVSGRTLSDRNIYDALYPKKEAAEGGAGRKMSLEEKKAPTESELLPPDVELAEDLTPEMRELETKAIAKYKKQGAKLLDEYAKLKTTDNGKIVNPDEAKKLFAAEGYAGHNAAAVQKVSGAVAMAQYKRLAMESPQQDIILNSGGSGTGKSSAAKQLMGDSYKEAAGIYDGNLSRISKAKELIQIAHDNGKSVFINNFYRSPLKAWSEGVIKRMLENPDEGGRVVPLDIFVKNHAGSFNTLVTILDEIAAGKLKDVYVRFVNNDRGFGQAKFENVDFFLNNAEKFSDPEALRTQLIAETKRLYENGVKPSNEWRKANPGKEYPQITKAQYEALIQ